MTDRNGFNKNAEKAANNGPGNELGEMPTWQFKGFYPDIESPEFEADFAKIAKDIEFFSMRMRAKWQAMMRRN